MGAIRILARSGGGGVSKMIMPGTTGNYVNTNITTHTDSFDIIFKAKCNNSATGGSIILKNSECEVYFKDNLLCCVFNGGTPFVSAKNVTSTDFANCTELKWYRVKWDQVTKNVTFYTATQEYFEECVWVQLGNVVNKDITIGSDAFTWRIGQNAGHVNLNGEIHFARIYSGDKDTGTLLVHFDANEYQPLKSATTWIGSNYETFTLTGSLIKINQISNVKQWNNVKANKKILSSYFTKYNAKTIDSNNQLTVLMAGDSIFARKNGTEISDHPDKATGKFQPDTWQQIIPYKLLERIQWGDADVNYFNLTAAEWTKQGTWSAYSNVDNDKHFENATQDDYVEITVTGCSFFKFIFRTTGTTVSTLNVTINGSAPSSLGLTGVDSFNTNEASNGGFCKFANRIWKGLNPATSYTFKFTKANALQTIVWGCETWNNARINLVNVAHGGWSAYNQNEKFNALFNNSQYAQDIVIFEVPALNDSYDQMHSKGGKNPGDAGISAVANDFIWALSAGTFTNYGGLVLAKDQYASYNGSTWVAGSTFLDGIIAGYKNYLGQVLSNLVAANKKVIFITPHRTNSYALRPWLITMLKWAKDKIRVKGFGLIDFDYKYYSNNITIPDKLSDGTHLNDIGVTEWMNLLYEIF